MSMKSRYALVAVLAGGLLLAASAQAEDNAGKLSGNLALTSDYIFRGLSQGWGGPAIQGGVEYAGASGFVGGASGSSISDRSYPGGSMEIDLYASYGRPIGNDWSWRAGVYSYLYPGANLDRAGLPSRSLTTVEANMALSWKILTVKYNHSLTDYFGADVEQGYRGDSKGSRYLQLDLDWPLADAWSLLLHAGHTHYTTRLLTPLAGGESSPDYSDVSAALSYQFAPNWSVIGGVTHADNAAFYGRAVNYHDASDVRNVGGTRGFVTVQGTF
ncbi:MAG: hypothetical protein J0I74_10245 [Rhodanobacter sp.]|uniref:TorF family putative porin n=1 Tax=Rhodanobacter geophilus TaxID=3162488 RepID=A0ABV3QP59_9GAMM|nr:hypothetical protein [Rhodanobacter sp.]